MGEVRQGNFSRGQQVIASTVGTALAAIGETILMDRGGQNPLKLDPKTYIKPVADVLHGWGKTDPATEKK